MQLSSNQLRTLHNDAFKGIEASDLELDLSENKLREVPRAVGALPNLVSLLLKANELR